MSNDSAWGTTSGFKSGYNLQVVNSYWTPPTEKNPNWSLVWDGYDQDDPDELIEGAIKLGAGSNWASFDGGDTVDHEEGNETKGGKVRQFHQNSGVGKLITNFVEQIDEDTLAQLETPRDARVWVGSIWYIDEEVNEFPDRNDKTKKVKFTTILPTKLISFGGATPSESSGDKPVGKSDFNPQVVSKLRDLAMASDDHAAFMNAALGLPEVPADDKLVIAISEEEFFQKLINGEDV